MEGQQVVAGEGVVVIMIQEGLPVPLVLLEEDFSVQMIGLVQCK